MTGEVHLLRLGVMAFIHKCGLDDDTHGVSNADSSILLVGSDDVKIAAIRLDGYKSLIWLIYRSISSYSHLPTPPQTARLSTDLLFRSSKDMHVQGFQALVIKEELLEEYLPTG